MQAVNWNRIIRLWVLIVFLLIVGVNSSQAGEILFPKSEEEITNALTKERKIKNPDTAQPSLIVAALIDFGVNSATIKPVSYKLLDMYGNVLRNNLADARMEIIGHSDNKGKASHNLELSRKRAEAVASYLINKHGIDRNRLLIRAIGEADPIASNYSVKGRALNRRVEFKRVD